MRVPGRKNTEEVGRLWVTLLVMVFWVVVKVESSWYGETEGWMGDAMTRAELLRRNERMDESLMVAESYCVGSC